MVRTSDSLLRLLIDLTLSLFQTPPIIKVTTQSTVRSTKIITTLTKHTRREIITKLGERSITMRRRVATTKDITMRKTKATKRSLAIQRSTLIMTNSLRKELQIMNQSMNIQMDPMDINT